MERDYWEEYWENYLRKLQDAYPNEDATGKYVEGDNLCVPTMYFEDYESYDDSYNVLEKDDDSPRFMFPGGSPSTPSGGQSPAPMISPGGGQFTINNCRRMAIVRIDMRRGFNPSNFFMVVDRADSRSIRGFRIACESGGRIRFVPMAVEYRNINVIECAF